MPQNDDQTIDNDEQDPDWIKDLRRKAKDHDTVAAERDANAR